MIFIAKDDPTFLVRADELGKILFKKIHTGLRVYEKSARKSGIKNPSGIIPTCRVDDLIDADICFSATGHSLHEDVFVLSRHDLSLFSVEKRKIDGVGMRQTVYFFKLGGRKIIFDRTNGQQKMLMRK